MTEKDYFRRLAAHDEWGNRKLIEELRKLSAPSQRALEVMAHILGTEWTWLSRIQRAGPPMKVWPGMSLDECERELPKLRETWTSLLRSADLSSSYPYTNTKGEHFESTIRDTLTHVFLHSHYHRGQIVRMIREAGAEPPYIDFIESVRKGYLD
ncbi:MAG: DinB family protein [Acidobacteriaceae bacterium]